MRTPPKDVVPLSFQGIRYEAPHFGAPQVDASVDAAEFALISQYLDQAVTADVTAGRAPDPRDPAWQRKALEKCPVGRDRIESFLDLMAFQMVVAPIIFKVTQELMTRSLAEGGLPDLHGPEVRAALEADGSLTPSQIERVLTSMGGPESDQTESHQHGGLLLAVDEASGKTLWSLQVYTTEYDPALESDAQDVFITELRLQGETLLVSDEAGLDHRVDLHARVVTETFERSA